MKRIHTFVVLAYKESVYLEECIKSVLNQEEKSEVLIATSTPNSYIENLAKKYNLEVIVNDKEKGIGNDFNFALSCSKTELVTIAHQDDIYDYTYSKEMIDNYLSNKDVLILFPNYYEIKNKEKVYRNRNLNIKKILLFPLRIKFLTKSKFIKRKVLSLGNSICCPSVCFSINNTGKDIFKSDMKCNIDWLAWERLSKKNGRFVYINKYLMGHRIHQNSTTSLIINNDQRSKEDFFMFSKFHPKWIAKKLTKLYKKSEEGNSL